MSVQVADSSFLDGIGYTAAGLARLKYERAKKVALKEKIILRRMAEADRVFGFETISITDDASIQKMLKKVSLSDMIIALFGSDSQTREAVYRNLGEKAKNHVKVILERLESGNAMDILVNRSRNMISEAFIELMTD
jgi:flagellar motor switch protein FliG